MPGLLPPSSPAPASGCMSRITVPWNPCRLLIRGTPLCLHPLRRRLGAHYGTKGGVNDRMRALVSTKYITSITSYEAYLTLSLAPPTKACPQTSMRLRRRWALQRLTAELLRTRALGSASARRRVLRPNIRLTCSSSSYAAWLTEAS